MARYSRDSQTSSKKTQSSPRPSKREEFRSLIRELSKREQARILSGSLFEFLKAGWSVIEPATPFQPNWHHEVVCAHLEAVTAGKIRDLLITLPPRYTKSTITSICWPAWWWTRSPGLRFLFASFKESLALDHSQFCRDVITSEWYRERWPDVVLRQDLDTKGKFANTKTGMRIAASVGSDATGTGGHVIVCDDPHALADSYSQANREAAVKWWHTVMTSRLSDRKTGARVVIGQRVHEGDLIGTLIKQGGWVHVNLPAEFVPSKTFSSPIGMGDRRKFDRELLWPEKFPAEVQRQIKKENGSFAYASQQMQDPAPEEGAMFNRKYFHYFRREGDYFILIEDGGAERRVRVGACGQFQTYDTAVKLKTANDYTVSGTFAITQERDLLVLHMERLRIPVPDLFKFYVAQRERWPQIAYAFAEDRSSGQGLIQEAARSKYPFLDLASRLRDQGITGLLGNTDKMQRAVPVSLLYEAGKVYHRAGAPWLEDLEHELTHFPVGEFDDQVDVIGYAGICFKYGPNIIPSERRASTRIKCTCGGIPDHMSGAMRHMEWCAIYKARRGGAPDWREDFARLKPEQFSETMQRELRGERIPTSGGGGLTIIRG